MSELGVKKARLRECERRFALTAFLIRLPCFGILSDFKWIEKKLYYFQTSLNLLAMNKVSPMADSFTVVYTRK